MMMSNLPADLQREIYSRIPATSLRRLRSICKQWNHLFKDPEFIEKQFRKSVAAKQSMVVLLKEFRVYSLNINLEGIDDPYGDATSKLISLHDSYYNSEQVDISDIFHCNGLLLCTIASNILKNSKVAVRLVVWNPFLG